MITPKWGCAEVDLAQHNPRTALNDLNRAVALAPSNPSTYSLRGLARAALGNTAGGLADEAHALALMPDDARSYWRRGLIETTTRAVAAARRDLKQAISLATRQGDLLCAHAAEAALGHLGSTTATA